MLMEGAPGLRIRPARPADRASILATVRTAFAGDEHDEQEEVDIVESIWSLHAEAAGLDLVAIRNDDVVGHVLGSWGDLDGHPVVGVAPLAVKPMHQGSGVGTALMTRIIRIGEFGAFPLFVLLGDPGYYRRFGLEPAGRFGVWYPPAGRDSPHFMLRRFPSCTGCPPGRYRYAWEL
jgi:putative acetyltransferase